MTVERSYPCLNCEAEDEEMTAYGICVNCKTELDIRYPLDTFARSYELEAWIEAHRERVKEEDA